MRAYELLEDFRQKRNGRCGDGWINSFNRIKSAINEKFNDMNVSGFIDDYLKYHKTNNVNWCVDVIIDFGFNQNEMILILYKSNGLRSNHERNDAESETIVFGSENEATSFIMAMKTHFEGPGMNDYKVEIIGL